MEIMIPVMNIGIFLLKFIITAIVVFVTTHFVLKALKLEPQYNKAIWRGVIGGMVILGLVYPLVFGVYQPKAVIAPLVKQEQRIYNEPKEVIIITPEPRTKELDGFSTEKKF